MNKQEETYFAALSKDRSEIEIKKNQRIEAKHSIKPMLKEYK